MFIIVFRMWHPFMNSDWPRSQLQEFWISSRKLKTSAITFNTTLARDLLGYASVIFLIWSVISTQQKNRLKIFPAFPACVMMWITIS